jgi:hypothetical protein
LVGRNTVVDVITERSSRDAPSSKEILMAQPASPSWPHRSTAHPNLHVDIRGAQEKIHVDVQNQAAAHVIGFAQRAAVREAKGR